MAETQKGVGVVWGLDGITVTGWNASEPTVKMQSVGLTFDGQKVELPDVNGETVGVIHYNLKKTVRLNIVPFGSSIANARTAADKLLPPPGTALTFTDSNGALLDGTYSGAFVVESAEMNRSNVNFATFDVVAYQYVANNVSATVT